MLIETEDDYKKIPPDFHDNPYCFHCHTIVGLPAIIWRGSTADIQFHPGCAATFLLALTRDLHEFKQSSGKVLTFGLSCEEKLQYSKDFIPFDDFKIPQYNVELTVSRFHFIDGGSEKVHIQDEKWTSTRCGHHFKQVRVIKERELDSDEVCHHCCKQGGVKIYTTGKYKTTEEDKN